MPRSLADKVLVVDDDPLFHKLVESVLTPAGITIEAVRSGEEAMRAVAKGPPKAVIIDGLLPGIRGDEVAIRLRQTWTQGQLPIVFVSAFFRDVRSRKRLISECQVDAVLHKPITPLKSCAGRSPVFPALAPKALPAGEEIPDLFELDLSTAAELLTDYLVIAQERMASLQAGIAALTGRNPRSA